MIYITKGWQLGIGEIAIEIRIYPFERWIRFTFGPFFFGFYTYKNENPVNVCKNKKSFFYGYDLS